MIAMLSQFSNSSIFKRVNHCASHKQITQYLQKIKSKTEIIFRKFYISNSFEKYGVGPSMYRDLSIE